MAINGLVDTATGLRAEVPVVLAASINAADSKTTPVDADALGLVDSAASNVLNKLTWANLKATLLTYFLPFFSRPNILINTNGLDPINQAGATTVANGAYGFDMWKLAHDCDTVTISATATGMRHTVTTKGEGTSCIPYQIVEGFASFKGKTVTISASVISNQAGTALRISDGVGTATSATTHTGGGTAETLTATLSVSASATKLWAEGIIGATGLADGDYIEWARIKLEEGSVATPYAVPSKGQELIDCRRYFNRIGTNGSLSSIGGALSVNTTQVYRLPIYINMRSTPVVSYGGNWFLYEGTGTVAVTGISDSGGTTKDRANLLVSVAAGLTQGKYYELFDKSDATAYIDFDARL
jgi:hypothetical protein